MAHGVKRPNSVLTFGDTMRAKLVTDCKYSEFNCGVAVTADASSVSPHLIADFSNGTSLKKGNKEYVGFLLLKKGDLLSYTGSSTIALGQ